MNCLRYKYYPYRPQIQTFQIIRRAPYYYRKRFYYTYFGNEAEYNFANASMLLVRLNTSARNFSFSYQ